MIPDIYSKAISHIRESIRRFMVVFAYTIVMYMAYVVQVIFISDDLRELMYNIMFGCIQGCLAAILLRLIKELRHPEIGQIHIAMLSAIPAIITAFILQYGYYAGKEALTVCICIGEAIIIFCVIIYILADNSHERYIYAWVTKSMAFSCFVAMVTGIGLSICITAIDSLLVSIDSDVYEYVWVFIGTVIFINLLCSYIPHKDDELHISQFFKVIVAYILLPIFLLLIAVLYLYIGKIVITLHMPSGSMNWFASFALAAWVFFWLTLRYVDNKLIQLYIRWGWILLVPIVTAQMTGVIIRLQAYGLTTFRYISLTCTMLGVIAMIVAAVGRRPRIMMVIVAIAAGIITISPLNIFDVPAMDQYYRFTGMLSAYSKFDSQSGFVEDQDFIIPAEDAEKIYSSYSYLVYGNSDMGYGNYDIDRKVFHSDMDMSKEELYTKLNMKDDMYGIYSDDGGRYYKTKDLINALDYIDTTGTTTIRPIVIHVGEDNYNYHEEFSDGPVVDVDLKDYVEAINTYCSDIAEVNDSQGYEKTLLTDEQSSIEVYGGRIWVSELSIQEYYVTDTPSVIIMGYYIEY